MARPIASGPSAIAASSSLDSPLDHTSVDQSDHVSRGGRSDQHLDQNSTLPSLPARERVHVSDLHTDSPWARKTILSLDGGGVKGYSSLLIVKRLMVLVAEIEAGIRPKQAPESDQTRESFYTPNATSSEYPWFHGEPYHSGVDPVALPTNPVKKLDEKQAEDIELTTEDSRGASEHHPYHYFDYIAGTSTGGLSAIMLGRLQMPVDRALAQYTEFGNEVFGKPRFIYSKGHMKLIKEKYSARRMKNATLKIIKENLRDELEIWEIFADEASLESDDAQCRTMAVSFSKHGQTKLEREYLFRSYDHFPPSPLSQNRNPPLNPGRAHREPIWKVARATSAAPTYFAPISFSRRVFKDGGMGTNNPAQVAFEEVEQMHDHLPSLILSVGTGAPEGQIKSRQQWRRKLSPAKLADMIRSPPIETNRIRYWKDEKDTMIRLATDSERTEQCMRKIAGRSHVPYSRFNVKKGLSSIVLDDWRPRTSGRETLETIARLTNDYLRTLDVNNELLHVARMLVEIRRNRAKTERWERFATDFIYFCPERSCNNVERGPTRRYKERNELREHGIVDHNFFVNRWTENSEETNIPCPRHSCVYQVPGLFTSDGLYQHLHQCHGIDKPVFKSPHQMEEWLDTGRISLRRALKHHEEEAFPDHSDPQPAGDNSPRLIVPSSETHRDTSLSTKRTRSRASTFQSPIQIRSIWRNPATT